MLVAPSRQLLSAFSARLCSPSRQHGQGTEREPPVTFPTSISSSGPCRSGRGPNRRKWGWTRPSWPRRRDYALTGGGSGYITRHGRLVMAWGDPRRLYDLKSTTKSFGSIALGLAIKDGKMRLEDKAKRHHPTFGVPPDEQRADRLAGRNHHAPPGVADGRVRQAGRLRAAAVPAGHGVGLQRPGPNWLAECITLAYRRDLDELDVRAPLHAAGHPAQRPGVAEERVPPRT